MNQKTRNDEAPNNKEMENKNNEIGLENVKYAKIRQRVIATIIDYSILIIFYIAVIIISLSFGLIDVITVSNGENITLPSSYIYFHGSEDHTLINTTTPGIFIAIFFIVYFTFLDGPIGKGQTIGKRIMNIRVVNITGGIPSFKQSLIRTITRFVDMIFFHIVGLLIMYVSDKNQRLGDKLGKTIVITALRVCIDGKCFRSDNNKLPERN